MIHDFPSVTTEENSTEMNDQAPMRHVNKALKVLPHLNIYAMYRSHPMSFVLRRQWG